MDELENGTAEAGTEGTAAPEQTRIEEMGAIFDRLTSETDAPEADAPTEPTAPVADTRPRDPSGKFAPKPKSEAAPTTAAPEQNTDPLKIETATAPASAPSGPPASWSAAAKAEWQKVPSALQAEIAKRETDVAKGFEQHQQRLAQTTEHLNGIKAAIAPIAGDIQAHGVTEAQAINHLASVWKFAKSDPVRYLQQAAQELGVDLSNLNQGQGQAQQGDPEVAALRQRLSHFESAIQQQQAQAQAQAESQVVNHIQQFAQSKDEAGNPRYPHFEAVRQDMAAMMAAGRAKDLADAYDKAVYANPDTRKHVLEAQQARSVTEAKERAAQATRVQRTNVATKGVTGASPSRAKTHVEEMAEIYDRVTAA